MSTDGEPGGDAPLSEAELTARMKKGLDEAEGRVWTPEEALTMDADIAATIIEDELPEGWTPPPGGERAHGLDAKARAEAAIQGMRQMADDFSAVLGAEPEADSQPLPDIEEIEGAFERFVETGEMPEWAGEPPYPPELLAKLRGRMRERPTFKERALRRFYNHHVIRPLLETRDAASLMAYLMSDLGEVQGIFEDKLEKAKGKPDAMESAASKSQRVLESLSRMVSAAGDFARAIDPSLKDASDAEAILALKARLQAETRCLPERPPYYPVTSESRMPTARPIPNIAEAFMGDKSDWVMNASENHLEFRPRKNASIIPYYQNSNQGIAPAAVYSSKEALRDWFELTRKDVESLSELELQMYAALIHHFVQHRTNNPEAAWVLIDLETIARLCNNNPATWNARVWSKWGAAFDRILKLRAKGEWVEYARGRNGERVGVYFDGPAIHYNTQRVRAVRDNKGQQSLLADFPVEIAYNLGAEFDRYCLEFKTQETILPKALLELDHHKEGPIIRLAWAYLLSFRMDAESLRGVAAGWTIEKHLEKSHTTPPEWVYARQAYTRYMKGVVEDIEKAASVAQGKAEFYDEQGERLEDPTRGLDRGRPGFDQWLKRTCRIIPSGLGTKKLVLGVRANRNKALGLKKPIRKPRKKQKR